MLSVFRIVFNASIVFNVRWCESLLAPSRLPSNHATPTQHQQHGILVTSSIDGHVKTTFFGLKWPKINAKITQYHNNVTSEKDFER